MTPTGGPVTESALRRGPLLSSGVLIGAGMGGFVDGILFHQILQYHNMLSAVRPPTNLIDAKINMTWDGYFHAAVWVMTALGIGMLWRAGQRRDVPWSTRIFAGSLLAGWGLFNLVEGTIDHEILGIHHVYEYTSNHLPADMAFLAFGAALLIGGWQLVRAGSRDAAPRGSVG